MDGPSIEEPLLLRSQRMGPATKDSSRMDAMMKEYRTWNPSDNVKFVGHTGAVWCCAMTSDNKYLFSGSEDTTVKVWEIESQSLYAEFKDHKKTVNGLEVTLDDKYLISGDWEGKMYVWDWRAKTKVAELEGHTAGVYCVALSKKGNFLISGSGDYTARIWDLSNYTQIGSCNANGNSIFGLAFGDNGKQIVCGGWDGVIRIFSFANQQLQNSFDPKSGVVQCLSVTNDGQYLIFGTRNNIVKVYKYKDRTEHCSFNCFQNWVRNVWATSDSNFFITVSADKSIQLFNIKTKVKEIQLEGSEGYVFGEYISKDGQFLLTGASDKIVRMWKLTKPLRTQKLEGHEKTVITLAVASDGLHIVTGSEDKSVRIWNIIKGTQVAVLNGHTETVWAVAISQDMKWVASCSGDKSTILWDFNEHTAAYTLTGHTASVFALDITDDCKYFVTGAQDKNVGVWSLTDKKLLGFLEGHTDTIFSVKATKNSKFFISGGADYTIRVWDIINLQHVERFESKVGMIESISFNADESCLAFGDRANNVHLWDWTTKKLLKSFTHHTKWVKSVSFQKDGNIFASCSNDSTVRLWDACEERHEMLLSGHIGNVRCVAFARDGRSVISGGEDCAIMIWNIMDISNLEMADISTSLDTFLYLAKIKGKVKPTVEYSQSVFGNLKVNLAHIYSYLGYNDLLLEALKVGTEIRIDSDGHSPLFYAIERNSQYCTDTILKYLINLKSYDMDRFLNYSHAIRGEFDRLLVNFSINLPEFLEAIFYTVPDLTNFAVSKATLPMLNYSITRQFNPDTFVYKLDEAPAGSKETPIEFKTMPFAISYVTGSSTSLEMLESITNCQNPKILQTKFIKVYVQTKWSDLWNFILLLTVLLWGNILFMCLAIIRSYVLDYKSSIQGDAYFYVLMFLILNTLLMSYEVVQAISSGIQTYFTSFWNVIDVFRSILCLCWGVSSLWLTQDQLYFLTWFMVVFNFFRGLTGFRAFSTTRFYTRLILRAFADSMSFVVIFFYSTFAFGIIYFTSLKGTQQNVFQLWQYPYQLNMGDIEGIDDQNPMQYLYFMMASVFNVIIMLNLLISILGDSFDSFQMESEQIDIMEMAELIFEIETLMFWKRDMNRKLYLQICKDLEVEGTGNWEGRVMAISNEIKRMRREFKLEFELLNQKINKVLPSK